MQALCRGDQSAFAELYDRYGGRMHRFFYRMLRRDAERARDFTQEIFIKIIEKPERYDPARPFPTWFYSVAMNMVKNEYRRWETIQNNAPDPENDLETDGKWLEKLDRPVFQQHLQTALDRLEEPQRRAFILRFQEELPLREIAEIENCPEGTVKSRLHYALRNLAAQLEIFRV